MTEPTREQLDTAVSDWNSYHHTKQITMAGMIIYSLIMPLFAIATGFFLHTRLEIESTLAYGLTAGLFAPLILWRLASGIKMLGDASKKLHSHDRSLVDFINRAVGKTIRRNPEKDPGTITFSTYYQTYNNLRTWLRWRGKIQGDTLTLVRLPGREIHFLGRNQFKLDGAGSPSGIFSKYHAVKVSFGLRHDNARIPMDSYNALTRWKQGL